MDKYLFIHAQTGQLLHHHMHSSSSEDPLAISMQLSALTQLAQQQLRYLQAKELITFAYSSSAPVFIALYFSPDAISIDEGVAMAQELMRTFMTLVGDWTGGKIRYKVFKQLDEAVQTAAETRLKATIKELFRELGKETIDFVYLTIPGEVVTDTRPLKHAETSMAQLSTPLTTDVSALARGSTPIPYSAGSKKKYPVQADSGSLPGKSADFYRMYPNRKEPNEHIMDTIAAIGKGCGELMETWKEGWTYVSLRMEERWLLGCKVAGMSVFAVMSGEPIVTCEVENAIEKVRIWATMLKTAAAGKSRS